MQSQTATQAVGGRCWLVATDMHRRGSGHRGPAGAIGANAVAAIRHGTCAGYRPRCSRCLCSNRTVGTFVVGDLGRSGMLARRCGHCTPTSYCIWRTRRWIPPRHYHGATQRHGRMLSNRPATVLHAGRVDECGRQPYHQYVRSPATAPRGASRSPKKFRECSIRDCPSQRSIEESCPMSLLSCLGTS